MIAFPFAFAFAFTIPALRGRECVRKNGATTGVADSGATYIRATRATAVVAGAIVAVAVAALIIFPFSRSVTSCRRW